MLKETLTLEAVVNNLQVLLLDLDNLGLVVEVVEAVAEVESIATEAIDNSAVESVTEDVVALRNRRRDGASSSETSREGESSKRLERHLESW